MRSLFFILLLSCINHSFQLKFFSGRPRDRYGFLGLPNSNKTNLMLNSANEDLWFEEQRLDHFDPTNTKIWKQVFSDIFFNFKFNLFCLFKI